MYISLVRTNRVMAVKRLRSTVDEREQKQLLMDLEVVMKSNDCPYIVRFYGALFKEVSSCFLMILAWHLLFQEVESSNIGQIFLTLDDP